MSSIHSCANNNIHSKWRSHFLPPLSHFLTLHLLGPLRNTTIPQFSPEQCQQYWKCAQNFVQNLTPQKAFLTSSIALGATLPLSILLAPSFAAVPFDLVVATAMPFHMYFGTKLVIQDYVPKPVRPQVLLAWGIVAAIASYGLVKISICGPGIGASIRSLWAPVRVEPVEEKAKRVPRRQQQ